MLPVGTAGQTGWHNCNKPERKLTTSTVSLQLYTQCLFVLNEPSNIPPPRFTYPKSEHLKSRKAIEQLFKNGESFFVYPYKVVYRLIDNGQWIMDNSVKPKTQEKPEQLNYPLSIINYPLLSGFSAPTRHFKLAVDRNRIKRLGREAFRLNKHPLEQQLTDNQLALQVFFIFTEKKLPDWKLVEPKMQACLKKLIHLTKKHHEKLLQG